LATCQIEKNMATIRASIFCYLTNTKDVLKKNLTITKMFWDNTVCDYTYVRRNISDTISSVGQNMTLFTVLRHPIDRFLSGYVDKCYNELTYFNEEERCFGCKYDMGCFLEKLQTLFLHNVRMTVDWKNPIYQHYLRHFAPQTWYCEFKKHKSKYVFVHYNNGPNGTEGIADDFDKIFEQAQIPRDIRSTIHREMMSSSLLIYVTRRRQDVGLAVGVELISRCVPPLTHSVLSEFVLSTIGSCNDHGAA
uniref:Sulfotransfer_1 domain-containing protein n=1 Tax=Heligmosomoides polygyrus TaxID=6339 RepID=A0A8L8KEJ2_HELPZ